MEKQNSNQLELFSQSGDSSVSRSRGRHNALLAYIWSYEKTILVIIGVVVIAVVSFSLGVEKGKRLSLEKNNTYLDVAQKPLTEKPLVAQVKLQKPAPLSLKNTAQDTGKLEIKTQPNIQGYTIQLASFSKKSYAEKEALTLKKNGLAPIILSKGKYVVLCVGSFVNKNNAQTLLTQLQKRYNSCYIRRL